MSTGYTTTITPMTLPPRPLTLTESNDEWMAQSANTGAKVMGATALVAVAGIGLTVGLGVLIYKAVKGKRS